MQKVESSFDLSIPGENKTNKKKGREKKKITEAEKEEKLPQQIKKSN